MRSLLSRGLWLVVLFVPALVSLLHGGPTTPPVDPAAELIKQLGSDVFARRLEASNKLIAMGEAAVPALSKAVASNGDHEIRQRSRLVLGAIRAPERKSKTTGMRLRFLDGGNFEMGSPLHEKNRRADEHLHQVTIKQPFYMGVFEVTQDEYQRVMDVNPSWFKPTYGGGKDRVTGMNTAGFPVDGVSWFDAIDFCNRLSKRDDLPLFYHLKDVKRDDGSIKSATVTIAGGNGYRLPTEAEWEFACRARSDGPYHFPKTPTANDGNFRTMGSTGGYAAVPIERGRDCTTKTGSFSENAFGLFDMHGNVAEWCWDFYDKDYYANSPRHDPTGPKAGMHRVSRGGAWLVNATSCRSASRFMELPGERSYTTGFRVARNP